MADIQIMGNVQAHQRQGNAAELADPCSALFGTVYHPISVSALHISGL